MAGLQTRFQLQMSWENSLLAKKRKYGPPLGFKNLGNTCYLNAVLQCLTYTPPLANFCLKFQHSDFCDSLAHQDKKSDCPFCLLVNRIVRSLSINSPLDTPAKIIGGLKTFAEHFRPGRQEDAHEFLRYVIDACHTTCLRLKKLQQQRCKLVTNGGGDGFGGRTVVMEIFGGALQSQVKCLACEYESNKVDEIMDISIDLINSSSLKEALQKYFQPEILNGNNKYSCDSCKKLVEARKQLSILQAPNILVIQLKRFDGIYGGKIDKAISFEEVLDLSSFMCKISQDRHPEYQLFATIVHSGFSPDSGHYYAYIKDALGRWYCCNDSIVSVSSLQEVLSEKAYILFFSRTEQRPVLPNKCLATNGTKPYGSNGNDSSKGPKSSDIVKSTDLQQCVNHQSQKIDSASSVVGKTQRKPVSIGTFGPKKPYNMKIIVHNKENNDSNGDAKGHNSKKVSDKKISLLEKKNGISRNKPVTNGNTEIHRNGVELVANGCKISSTINGTATVKVASYQGDNNGMAKNIPDKPDSPKKYEEQKSCYLIPKREELKETLVKEAFSVLRKCSFLDDVQSCMVATKLRAQDVGNDALQKNELKRKMISDAKASLISQIPNELKADLVKRIKAHIGL